MSDPSRVEFAIRFIAHLDPPIRADRLSTGPAVPAPAHYAAIFPLAADTGGTWSEGDRFRLAFFDAGGLFLHQAFWRDFDDASAAMDAGARFGVSEDAWIDSDVTLDDTGSLLLSSSTAVVFDPVFWSKRHLVWSLLLGAIVISVSWSMRSDDSLFFAAMAAGGVWIALSSAVPLLRVAPALEVVNGHLVYRRLVTRRFDVSRLASVTIDPVRMYWITIGEQLFIGLKGDRSISVRTGWITGDAREVAKRLRRLMAASRAEGRPKRM